MKPVITFTDYIENNDEQTFSIELLAKVNGKLIKAVSPYVAKDILDEDVKRNLLLNALDMIARAAAIEYKKEGIELPNTVAMNLLDMYSMFDVKQSKQFNIDMLNAGRDPHILLLIII